MRPTHRVFSHFVIVALALSALGTSEAQGQERCVDKRGPTPQGDAKKRGELAPNSKRTTLTVKSDAGDAATASVVLPVKGGKSIGKSNGSATAGVTDVPSFEGRELDADIALAARPTATGNGVVVRACISDKGRREAGTFEGALQVYGPRFNEFTYSLVVTSKWRPVVPIVILILVVILFLAMEVKRPETGGTGAVAYLTVAVGGALLTYFSQYEDVDTWGDNPGLQIPGLAVAAITAAAAGRAAAVKFFSEKT